MNGIKYDQVTGIFIMGDDMNAFMSITPGTQTNMFKANTFNFLNTNNQSIANLLDNGGNAHIQLGAFSVGNGTFLDIDDGAKTITLFSDGIIKLLQSSSGIPKFSVNMATGQVNTPGIPTYVDDAAAILGGLVSGDWYKTTNSGVTSINIVP